MKMNDTPLSDNYYRALKLSRTFPSKADARQGIFAIDSRWRRLSECISIIEQMP